MKSPDQRQFIAEEEEYVEVSSEVLQCLAVIQGGTRGKDKE